MSLRLRLTLMNLVLIGTILFLFGAAVYGFVGVILINQIDETLFRAFTDILQVTEVGENGELEVLTLSVDLTSNVYVQAWSREGRLRASSMNITSLRRPLDPVGMQSVEPLYRDSIIGEAQLRVLTVPLEIGDRPVGRIQVAQSLALVRQVQQVMVLVMLSVSLASMLLAGIASWLTADRALAPLAMLTHNALEITRTNDLSRRIPSNESTGQEVSQLIQAFNQTLGRLERLIKAQRRFLTDVGHEFRTPLTVIRGNVDLMKRIKVYDEESLESIEVEVERLTRLVGDLLLLAQAESGKLPLDRRVVSLDTVLLEVFRQAQILAKDKLSLRLGHIDQVQVCGDQDRLKQVLINLISNAIKYTPAGGQVVTSLATIGNQTRVTVTDSGPGIPAEELPHIFDRFYRGEKSRRRSQTEKGFGLGLSIAYWIVRNHEGRIEVTSEPGKGTTFTVWLPQAEEDCAEQPARAFSSLRN